MGRALRWGVIGSGGIARRRTIPEGILKAANAELVAVYSRDLENNAAVAREFDCRAAASVPELLRSGIDAVYMASPPGAHLEQVRACAQAGIHVFCEKPLGLTVTEAEAMLAACRQAGVQLGTAFMMRFSAQHQTAAALVREGRLGTLVLGRAQLSCWYPPIEGAWRQHPQTGGGGSLIDMGGHCIDLLEMFLGPVESVSCLLQRRVHDYPVEDSAVVSLRFRGGALGMVDAFFCIPDDASRNRLELYGTKGNVLAEGTIGQEALGTMVATLTPDTQGYDARQAREPVQSTPIDPPPVNTYRTEIEAFGDAILRGIDPEPSGEAGLHSQRVLAACYQSAATGRLIQV
ncbi:MAG: Gfo/Idh/MocA family oxidoreductase [Verrucomicrobiales bacterium]|nr:Gfo/Idh/MocA family oxidoreductase [Verrucomicrobiales bacterium]